MTCSVLDKIPAIGSGKTYGADPSHDIITAIHPTKSWWMKSWCEEKKHWHRHKSRHNFCRRCKQWMLAIGPSCKGVTR